MASWLRRLCVVPLAALALAGAVCMQPARAQQHPPPHPPPPAPAAPAAPSAEEDDDPPSVDGGAPDVALPRVRVELLGSRGAALARGNGVTVTAEELYQRVHDAPEPTQLALAQDPAALDALVDRMVSDRLMVTEARRLGLENDPQVRAAVERALVARLRALQVNPAADGQPAPTPEQLRAFYDSHPERFHIPERRRVWVLFLPDRRTAERALVQLRAAQPARRGPLFRQLQAELNRDADLARLAGDFQELTAASTELDPAVRDAAFGLTVQGEVCPSPIPGRWGALQGFFVVRYVSRRPPIERTYAESTDWIRLRLLFERRVRAEEQLVARLREAARVSRTPAATALRLTVADGGVEAGAP